MKKNYFSFLDLRAAKRRLTAKFARPRWLILHVVAFISVMLAILGYGSASGLWFYAPNYELPTVFGAVWSIALTVHAILHFRHSSAMTVAREVAVEEEMRQFIEQHADQLDHEMLFSAHEMLETPLKRRGRWSLGLLLFTLVNCMVWIGSALSRGTSFPFQTTLLFAVIIIGSVNLFMIWQEVRRLEQTRWFSRFPLRHTFVYAIGGITLWLMAAFRMISPWDAPNIMFLWSIVLFMHILWSVVIWPVIHSSSATQNAPEPREKRKSAERLILTDDGELLDMSEKDTRHYRTNTVI